MIKLDKKKYNFTKEEFNFFWENGYIIIKNLFSHEETERVYQIFKENADKSFSAIINLDRKIPELQNIMKMPRTVSIIEGMLEGEAYGLMTQMLFKQAGSRYQGQSWTVHQDNSYHQNPNGKTITTNLACEDADVENGTLFLYPGSHKEGVIKFEARKSFREDKGKQPGNTLVLPKKYEDRKIDCIMKKGDVLFLHGNCVHGSYPNKSKTRSRPLYSITYIKKGEKFSVGRTANRKEFSLH